LPKAGWKVEMAEQRRTLPAKIKKRYPHIPAAAIDFIEQVKTCANGDETSWFLTAEDYARSGEPWPWDSFESMLLEDMDKEEQGEVRTFWDAHFPIFFSVGGEYTYMAINVDKNSKDFGSVVEADMAYYDEPGVLAQSYEKFWQDAIACLKGSLAPDTSIAYHLMPPQQYEEWYKAKEKAQPRKTFFQRFYSRLSEVYKELRIILARID
jgi:hypothetical protein